MGCHTRIIWKYGWPRCPDCGYPYAALPVYVLALGLLLHFLKVF